ncbi:MAG: phospho-N-acetylmuramoyl-pentapeptide-transferase [Planctomycetota bacterium]
MLYQLLQLLGEVPGAGLFRYISFRAAGAAVCAFVVGVLLGRPVIAWLAQAGVGEDTECDSAEVSALHAGKKNTPTMGGVFIVGSILLSCVLWMRFDGFNRYSLWGLVLVAAFALVGGVDDWIKLRVPGKRGLSKRSKQLLLTLIAVLVAWALVHQAGLEARRGGPHLYFPFVASASLDLSAWWGVPFVFVAVAVLTGGANAVNLTDGLDGLAIGCVGIAGLAYAGITYFVGHQALATYLLIEHVPGCGEMTVMLAAMVGASLAFLWYNASPAQVFMGDVGSLALGGALGYAALVSRTEIVLFVVGGVFVAEALSVILQVASFRTTGRRVFRCAPLHHHFQLAGVPETKIVVRIWIVAALLALSSLALFKVR